MSMLETIVLAVVQGLTEFLPISSSGHIVLGAWLFGWEDPGLLFNAVVHMGTLAAVLAYFWRDWMGIVVGFFKGGDSTPSHNGDPPYDA
ncbi:MAG: undecaprenyl-diphosphate phosphatase, partial [Chloroflexota bacterium]